jgi:hypothetical protein
MSADSRHKIAALIDGTSRQARGVDPLQNLGKILRVIPDPVLRQSTADAWRAGGYSVSDSTTSAIEFRLLQLATMPSGETPSCPDCGGPRLRPWKCHECWNEYQRGKQGDRREKAKRALEIIKRSGLS